MERLNTIQKYDRLNDVFKDDTIGENAASRYMIIRAGAYTYDEGYVIGTDAIVGRIYFQNGSRKDVHSVNGVTEVDLLEIVRDRLKDFQKTEYATRENDCAITNIEEALMWMNKRIEDRAERGVLGTMEK